MPSIDERLDVSPVGVEFVPRPAGAQSAPDTLVFDVIGRAGGLITEPLSSRHLHTRQSERNDGQFTRLGLLGALAGARMLLELADVGHATLAPPALQRAAAPALLRVWRECTST
jgi:hypothetical protein